MANDCVYADALVAECGCNARQCARPINHMSPEHPLAVFIFLHMTLHLKNHEPGPCSSDTEVCPLLSPVKRSFAVSTAQNSNSRDPSSMNTGAILLS
jgi:hypothetical protein